MSVRDVLIVGAGPAGLAAGIAATKAGLTYQIIEKGALVNSLLHYPTEMVFFTTPELMEIGGLPFVSPYDKPTRLEALRYYRRVRRHVQARHRVRRDGRWRSVASAAPRRQTDRSRSRTEAPRRAASVRGRNGRARDRRVRLPNMHRRAGRGSAARLALLHVAASVLSQARRDCRRQELGGRSGARAVSRRRARDDRASPRRARRLDQVLGEAGHREPDQGRLGGRALQHPRRRDHADRGRRRRTRRDGRASRRTACFS